MAFTRDWDESTPTDNTNAVDIDDYNRYLRVDVSDRLENMFYGFIAGENSLSQHAQYIQFYEQASVSQPSAGYGRLYCKAVGGKCELHWQDEDGDEIQITTGGKWNGAVLSADSVSNAILANMTRGTVKTGGTSDAPTDLDAKTDGYILIGDGTDVNSVAVSGDITITNAGVTTIGSGKVDPGMMAAGSAWRTDGTTVFNTSMTAAGTFQDLDLSSYVGSNAALCYLEVKSSGGAESFAAKPKGYGGVWGAHYDTRGLDRGVSAVHFQDANDYGYILVATDSSGVIQIAALDNTTTYTIKLIGFLK